MARLRLNFDRASDGNGAANDFLSETERHRAHDAQNDRDVIHFEDGALEAHAVSTRVNNPRNDDDACIEPPGATAWLAVRPEKMLVHLDPPPAGPNRLEGKVADIGYLGDWTTYLVELPGGRTIRAARANASRVVERPVDWDDRVWLTFAPDSAVVLTK